MKRIWTAALAAFAMLATSLAPAPALARDYHGYGGRGYYGGGHYYHHHDNGDAVAAGAVGLILGLAVGSALSDNGSRYDRCDRCAPPPPRCYDRCGYDDRRADYDRDYGYEDRGSEACVRQVQQWDPYSGRYVWVNLRQRC